MGQYTIYMGNGKSKTYATAKSDPAAAQADIVAQAKKDFPGITPAYVHPAGIPLAPAEMRSIGRSVAAARPTQQSYAPLPGIAGYAARGLTTLAGVGQGISNSAAGLGEGVGNIGGYFGLKDFQNHMATGAQNIRNFTANAMHVAQQAYPTSTAVGNAVGDVVAPALVLGGAGEVLGAGGSALARSGVPIMRAVAPTLARVSSAIGSGGFSTGKAINTIGQGVAALPYRVLGGATAGAANHLFRDPSDPNSLVNDAGAGAVTSALGAPLGKALGSLGRGVLERAFGAPAMVQGGKILRASVQNVVGRARLALENAQPGETAMQALTRQGVDAPVLAAMFKLNSGTSADGATYLLHKAETDLNQQTLREASGQGQTATEAYRARRAAEAQLNQDTAPLRSGALDDANVGNITIPPLEKDANAAATSAADLSAQAKRMGGLADRQATLSTNPELSIEAMNKGKALSGLADQYSERAAAGSLEQGEIARVKQEAIDALRESGYDKLSSQPILDNLQAIHDSPDIAANKPARGVLQDAMNIIGHNAVGDTVESSTIDPQVLYSIRKNVANNFADFSKGLDPGVIKKQAAAFAARINPVIDSAIDKAGGSTGAWQNYLSTFGEGMDKINGAGMLSDLAQRYADGDAKGVAKIIHGGDPEYVLSHMGPGGTFDVEQALGDKYPQALQVANNIKTAQAIKDAEVGGMPDAEQLIRDNTNPLGATRMFQGHIGPIRFRQLDGLSGILPNETRSVIDNAARDPEALNKALDYFPIDQRNRFAAMLTNPGTAQQAAMSSALQRYASTPGTAPPAQDTSPEGQGYVQFPNEGFMYHPETDAFVDNNGHYVASGSELDKDPNYKLQPSIAPELDGLNTAAQAPELVR